MPPDPNTEIAQALTAIARARYGKHLTDEGQKVVRRRIGSELRSAAQLKRIKLKNGDEPAFIFRADVP
jgi:hypothetical protein